MDCKECHGSAFTLDLDMHATNLRHLYYQVSGRIPERVRLKDAAGRPRRRQLRRAATATRSPSGRAGGHSVAYSHIFLSAKHNAKTRLMDDCLRCHGMFADGNVADIVAPIDNGGRGAW